MDSKRNLIKLIKHKKQPSVQEESPSVKQWETLNQEPSIIVINEMRDDEMRKSNANIAVLISDASMQ